VVFAVNEYPRSNARPHCPDAAEYPKQATHDSQRNNTVDLCATLDIAPRQYAQRYLSLPHQDNFIRL